MGDREFESEKYRGNPLLHWQSQASTVRTVWNTAITQIAKIMPLGLKNTVLRALGTDIGENTAIGLGVQIDIFFPEKISIGENTTIGYGTTILTHETTQEEFRKGEVKIGDNVLIGANTTILPGVEIGDGAKVSANSLVNRDIEEDSFVGGVPAEKIEEQ
ncbi:acyltransferase [Candidatus Nanosalina sp. VS9-1]|uniref:acyltransferase n=1 Tax=Candidatus Nanosalina sp. VS9-1 TaxID=3388566 RepID=UPI0039E03833